MGGRRVVLRRVLLSVKSANFIFHNIHRGDVVSVCSRRGERETIPLSFVFRNHKGISKVLDFTQGRLDSFKHWGFQRRMVTNQLVNSSAD